MDIQLHTLSPPPEDADFLPLPLPPLPPFFSFGGGMLSIFVLMMSYIRKSAHATANSSGVCSETHVTCSNRLHMKTWTKMLTFLVFRAHLRAAVDEVLNNFRPRTFDGAHERRGFVERARFEVGAEVEKELDDVENACVTREVQRRPLEVVSSVHVRPATKQHSDHPRKKKQKKESRRTLSRRGTWQLLDWRLRMRS